MNVLYAFNDNYAEMAGISIFSLLKNADAKDKINVHIIDSGISKQNIERLKNTIESRGHSVFFYEMSKIDNISKKEFNTRRWNINVFCKLFLGDTLPRSVKKIISIDCDTVITKSLSAIWEIDLDGYVVAGVNECMSPLHRTILDMDKDDYYLNSGLIVFNLEKIRNESYESMFLDYLEKYGSSLAYLDQDVINAVVPQNRKLLLHPKYNSITPLFCLDYKDFKGIRKAESYYSEQDYGEARNDPIVIHFTTFFLNQLRPWFKGSKHPKVEVYLNYKNESLWKDVPLKERKNKLFDRVIFSVIKLLPMWVICPIVSYLHGVVAPKKHKREMLRSLKGKKDE